MEALLIYQWGFLFITNNHIFIENKILKQYYLLQYL